MCAPPRERLRRLLCSSPGDSEERTAQFERPIGVNHKAELDRRLGEVEHEIANRDLPIDIKMEPEPVGSVVATVINVCREINAADLPRLFDRFYCAYPPREHGAANYGLGLLIVAVIARACTVGTPTPVAGTGEP